MSQHALAVGILLAMLIACALPHKSSRPDAGAPDAALPEYAGTSTTIQQHLQDLAERIPKQTEYEQLRTDIDDAARRWAAQHSGSAIVEPIEVSCVRWRCDVSWRGRRDLPRQIIALHCSRSTCALAATRTRTR